MSSQSYALFTPVLAIGNGVGTLTLTDTNDFFFEVPDAVPGGQSALINGSPVTINAISAALGPQVVVALVNGINVELSLTPVRIIVDGVLFDTTYIVYPGLPEGAQVISVSLPLLFPDPVGLPVCLTTETRVRTDRGWVRAGRLQPGDLVMTMDHGLQPVRWIGRQHLAFRDQPLLDKFRPIRIAAGALGRHVPRWPLTVSPQHAILLQSPHAMLLFDDSEVFLAAKHLVNGTTVAVDRSCDEVTYCHILLDMHAVIEAEGAPVESLFLGPVALESVGCDARAEILALFPELASHPDTGMVRARTLLREYEARVLLDRMFDWTRPAAEATPRRAFAAA